MPDHPGGSCVEDSNIYESAVAVALRRTGSDQTVNNVVSTVGTGMRPGRWRTLPGGDSYVIMSAGKLIKAHWTKYVCGGYTPGRI